MRKLLLSALLVSFSVPAMASCDDLKAQIDAKLKAKGVVSYTLQVVPAAQAAAAPAAAPATASGAAAAPAKAAAGKVVGSCEGDTKQVVYTRN